MKNYLKQYQSINLESLPDDVSAELKGIYENTQGFIENVDLEGQNFEDLFSLVKSAFPEAIQKKITGKGKKMSVKVIQLKAVKSKSNRISNAKQKSQKRKEKIVKSKSKKQATKPKAVAPKKAKIVKSEQQKVDELKKEVETLRQSVISNAKFKNKLGDEVRAYLNSKGLATRIGLGNTADAMKILREKKKLYSNLLSGDIQDFKTIGKRIGIIYRKQTVKNKEAKESGGLSGLPSDAPEILTANTYFWQPSRSSSGRRASEKKKLESVENYFKMKGFDVVQKNDNVIAKGFDLEIVFSYRESTQNVYKSLSIYRNGKKSNITALNKVL